MQPIETRVFIFDWKDSAGAIIDTLVELQTNPETKGKFNNFYTYDTQSDSFCLIVSNVELNETEVKAVYDEYCNS